MRELVATLIEQVSRQGNELRYRQARVDQLTHEMAVVRRLQFAARSDRLGSGQSWVPKEAIEADLQAFSHELDALQLAKPDEGRDETPKRQPLPTNLPRIEFRHEPENRVCGCGPAVGDGPADPPGARWAARTATEQLCGLQPICRHRMDRPMSEGSAHSVGVLLGVSSIK